jgi:hypothetical protein
MVISVYFMIDIFMNGFRTMYSSKGAGGFILILGLGIWKISGLLVPSKNQAKMLSIFLRSGKHKYLVLRSDDQVKVLSLFREISSHMSQRNKSLALGHFEGTL